MKLTEPIKTGTIEQREAHFKKQGCRLMTFADIKKIYDTNDKKNIAILEKDMKESWVKIRAEKSYDEATLKRMANGREIYRHDKLSDVAVWFNCNVDRFHVYGNNWILGGGYVGLSRGMLSDKSGRSPANVSQEKHSAKRSKKRKRSCEKMTKTKKSWWNKKLSRKQVAALGTIFNYVASRAEERVVKKKKEEAISEKYSALEKEIVNKKKSLELMERELKILKKNGKP